MGRRRAFSNSSVMLASDFVDDKTSIRKLRTLVSEFVRERDWEQYHNEKDLALDISIEAAELLEHFRFKSEREVDEIMKDRKKREEVEDELSDVVFGAIAFANIAGIDIASAFVRKLEKNRKKYPVRVFKGLNKKYNEV